MIQFKQNIGNDLLSDTNLMNQKVTIIYNTHPQGIKNILHHASTSCTDSENKACEDKIYKATVLELETPGKEEIKQKNKIKAKPSDNKTSETESRSEHLDPEMEKCKEFSSEKSFNYVQIKSKRGRTTAKIDYSKL